MCELPCCSICKPEIINNPDEADICCNLCCGCRCIKAKKQGCGVDIGRNLLLSIWMNPLHADKGTYSKRTILNRQAANAVQVLYDIPVPAYVPGCICCQCYPPCCCPRLDCSRFCCKTFVKAEEMRSESMYQWIMENRLETNNPYVLPGPPKGVGEFCAMLFGCWCFAPFDVWDNAEVNYFDHYMFSNIKELKGCGKCTYNWQAWTKGARGEPLEIRSHRCPFLCPCFPPNSCPFGICATPYITLLVEKDTSPEWRKALEEAVKAARDRAPKPSEIEMKR